MKAFNTKNISIPQLEQEAIKMGIAGKKERWAIEKLIQLLNCNDKYYYQFIPTDESKKIGYEGIIYVKNKLTDRIYDLYIIEAKVREDNIIYNDLFYEQKKHNTLKRIKQNLIKLGTSFEPKILYVNFCFDGTFLYFIDDIIFEGNMPKIERIKMNEVTVTSRTDKVTKGVYLLHKDLAIKKDFIYNDIEYATYILDNVATATKEANEIIKKTYSIF